MGVEIVPNVRGRGRPNPVNDRRNLDHQGVSRIGMSRNPPSRDAAYAAPNLILHAAQRTNRAGIPEDEGEVVVISRQGGDQLRRPACQAIHQSVEAPHSPDDDGKQDHDPHPHDQPLHHVGPDDGAEPAVSRIEHHDSRKDQQPRRISPTRREVEGAFQNDGAGSELGHQVARREQQDCRGQEQTQRRRLEPVAEHVGNRDRICLAADLVEPLAQHPHGAQRIDHVTGDPKGQDPTVTVNQRRESDKTARRGGGCGKGERQRPTPQISAPQEVLPEKAAAGQEAM